MVMSMTAFGRAKTVGEKKDITIEIKSVNSRFFDCNVKMPRTYSFLEEKIKNYIKTQAVGRAKVDCYITVESHSELEGEITVDRDYLESYLGALRVLRDEYGLADDISVMSVARNEGVLICRKSEEDPNEDWEQIKLCLDEALAGYREMRRAEGERLLADITEKIEKVRVMSEKISEFSESDKSGYRAKLEARLRSILEDNSVEIDENRILTECAIWADKIAIDEELVRLRSHFDSFYELIGLDEPPGRKLDFLLQEFNRETNTIGSKCNNSQIAHIVVDMKGELEKIREQVQNIE